MRRARNEFPYRHNDFPYRNNIPLADKIDVIVAIVLPMFILFSISTVVLIFYISISSFSR